MWVSGSRFSAVLCRAVVVSAIVVAQVALFGAPPSSASPAPGLAGESFSASGFVIEAPGVPAPQCDPSSSSVLHFSASGTATGPYPGTFSESGVVTFGPQTEPAPQSYSGLAGSVLTFSGQFQIASPAGTVSGTKVLTEVLAGSDATNTGTCGTFVDAPYPGSATIQSVSGREYVASVRSTYNASITTADETTADAGTASTRVGETHYTAITCFPGVTRCLLVSAALSLSESFFPPDPSQGNADLALTKEGPATANAGEELTYHLKVKNNGPDVATNVLVNDTLPAGLVVVSTDPASPACQGNLTVVCNLGTLQVGQIGVATIVARATQAGPVHNDATVTSDQGDGNLDDNSSGWSTDVGPPPTVSVTKGVRVLAGPELQYTIDVENLGPTTAYGVVAKDILDDPRWSLLSVQTTKGVCDSQVVCDLGTLAVGEKETVTITLGVFVTEPIHNDVEVTWYGGGSAHAGVTSPGLPRLVVSKTHRGDFYLGGTGQYFVAVGNIGSGATTDPIVVTDTLPAGMTFAGGGGDSFTCGAVGQIVTCTRTTPLDPGASANFAINVLVATDAPPQVNNVIEVAGGGGFVEPQYGDPGSTVDPPKLGVTKIVKEHTVRIGHNFTYLIDVTNTGARTASNVTVIDTLPGSVDLVSITPGAPTCTGTLTIWCNLGDLPVGATVTVEIQVKAREITVLDNVAFAWADGLLPVSSGHVSTPVKPEATFEVTKTADKPVVVENSNLRYTITAKNLGPGDTTNVKINDPLPANVELVSIDPDPTYAMTCNVTTPPQPIALNGPVVCAIPLLPELTVTKVVITIHVLRYGPLANTATVTCDDCNPTGTSSTATVQVKRPPAVAPIGPYTVPEASTVQLHGSATDPDGDAITYAWDLDNNGTFETSGQNPVFSAVTRDGPATQPISLKVCDVDGFCTTVGTTVTITNVPPTISSVTNNGPVAIGTPARIDVVASDVAGPIRDPLRYEFDCDNNGTYEVAPQAASTTSCTFATSGTHTVRVRVNDGDGGVALGSTDVLVYGFPSRGQFVIGNLEPHGVGATVDFWGNQWAKDNPLSGGPAPSAFIGYDNVSAVPVCGRQWSSDPGNSSVPPATVPAYMAVIVSTKVTKTGSAIGGDIKEVVVIRTAAGYSSNPGHPAKGAVVAVLCRAT